MLAPRMLTAIFGVAAAVASPQALLRSRELWATIDVCSPPGQRDTVGVRGSMPGDGLRHDTMYMSFRLQYMSSAGHWLNVASGASSGWEPVGSAASPRQGGSSFSLKTVKHATTFRGVVEFQWRRAGKALVTTTRLTSAGHKSLAGADPPGYSAATCMVS